MECTKCKQTMDEESKEFHKDYNINWCLDCCGKDYEDNVKAGRMFCIGVM